LQRLHDTATNSQQLLPILKIIWMLVVT
jgi:hypothetical protein